MIKIQPYGNQTFNVSKSSHNSRPSFGHDSEDAENSIILDDEKNHNELKQTRESFRKIRDRQESPSIVKKVASGGVILATGLVGGFSMKYGLDYTFHLFSDLMKKNAVKPIVKGLKDSVKEIKKGLNNIGKDIKKSKAYKNFAESVIGKKTLDLYAKMQKTEVYVSVNKGLKNINSKAKEWFISVASGVSAICSGAEAAGVVKEKPKNNDHSTIRHNHYDEVDCD